MTPRWDSHIHLFATGIGGDTPPDEELKTYLRFREKYGIAGALVVAYEGTPEHVGNNDYVLERARAHSWIAPVRFVAGGSPVSELEDEFVGYSLYLNDWTVDSAEVADAFGQLSSAGITSERPRPLISINANQDALAAHRSAFRRLEGCTVMISHLGLPGGPAADRAAAEQALRPLLDIADEADLVVKVSGIYATDTDPAGAGAAPYVEVLLERLGASRLTWGSDFAPVLAESTEEDGFSIRPAIADLFTADQTEAVMGGNLSGRLRAAGFRVDEVVAEAAS